MAVDVDHPTLGRVRSLGSPLEMSATPTNPRRRAPMLGEHTEEVLREHGFSENEISAMRTSGAIRSKRSPYRMRWNALSITYCATASPSTVPSSHAVRK